MSDWVKSIVAGPLHVQVLCPFSDDEATPPKSRGPKENSTAPPQEFYNNKKSYRELELYTYTNFFPPDKVITLTYDDRHLPISVKAAERGAMKRYTAKMRQEWLARGYPLKYIYCTECKHGKTLDPLFAEDDDLVDHRIHHHMVVNDIGAETIALLRDCWGRGFVKIEPLELTYIGALAQYMTKEVREFGRDKPGTRSWKRSMGLSKYKVEYFRKPSGFGLQPPPGAVNYEFFHEKNPHGYSDIIGQRYLILPEAEKPALSYTKGPSPRKHS